MLPGQAMKYWEFRIKEALQSQLNRIGLRYQVAIAERKLAKCLLCNFAKMNQRPNLFGPQS
jgi:hypothetical protein